VSSWPSKTSCFRRRNLPGRRRHAAAGAHEKLVLDGRAHASAAFARRVAATENPEPEPPRRTRCRFASFATCFAPTIASLLSLFTDRLSAPIVCWPHWCPRRFRHTDDLEAARVRSATDVSPRFSANRLVRPSDVRSE